MPKVSVVMPVFNGGEFVEEAVDSILRQSFTDFEFIIIDDGSTDDSVEKILRYKDKRIVFLRNSSNAGITKTLNIGLVSARGEYISRMDADDIALPERFGRQVAYLDAHPETAIVGSLSVLIDRMGKEIGFEGPAEGRIGLSKFVHNPFIHSSVLFRSTVLKRVGPYDEKRVHNEDYDLWLRILKEHEGFVLPEILIERRIHPASITSSNEIELVGSRLKTISHSIFFYYKNPLLSLFLVRPLLAYWYRRMINPGRRG